MNSNQKGINRLNSTFSDAILQAKEFVGKQKKQNEEKVKQIMNSFYKGNINHMFETKGTILRNQDDASCIPKDFIYYKLDTKYLKTIGVNLKLIDSNVISSKIHANIVYIESYLNIENSCIIFVEYHFKHIRLLSSNKATDLNTFVFINSKSDVYYYDVYSNFRLLRQYITDMNVNCAKKIFTQKQFKVLPADERTYELTSFKNSEKYEKKNMKDIHLIPKQLFDILLEQYKNDVIPENSELKIETHFIGITQNNHIFVQTKVVINHSYFGIIENIENLLEYEIVLYFLSNPKKKVKAKFYLTECEKNQYLILEDRYLEDAILEEFDFDDDMIKRKTSLCESLYAKHCISKIPFSIPDLKSIQSNIAKMFFENITIESFLLEYPLLKDTFRNIYIETFNINTDNFVERYIFGQIKENRIEYVNEHLIENSMYFIFYQNNIYLIEVFSEYTADKYENNSFILYLPKFNLSGIKLNIFNPINEQEVDKFLEKKLDSDSLKRSIQYNNSYYNIPLSSFKSTKKTFEKAFSDFDIVLGEKQNSYDISDTYTNSIYEKILNCIKNPSVLTASFLFLNKDMSYGSVDSEYISKIPISTNGLIYAYYCGYHSPYINSSFSKNDDNSISTSNNLLKIKFDKDAPFFKTSLFCLMQSAHLEIIKCQLRNYNLLDNCINFLLINQNIIFSN